MLARLDAWMLGNLSAARKFAKCVVDLTIMTAQNVRLILHNLGGVFRTGRSCASKPHYRDSLVVSIKWIMLFCVPRGILGIWMTSIPSSHIISLLQICRRESLCCDLCWEILCGVAS